MVQPTGGEPEEREKKRETREKIKEAARQDKTQDSQNTDSQEGKRAGESDANRWFPNNYTFFISLPPSDEDLA